MANLFPEKLDTHPGYRVKDKLETAVHGLVCGGKIGLRTAQQQLAVNWQALYAEVFGAPSKS